MQCVHISDADEVLKTMTALMQKATRKTKLFKSKLYITILVTFVIELKNDWNQTQNLDSNN